MARIFNFSAGPSVIPDTVLQRAADEMLDWHGSGVSVMEMSHRGPEFESILHQAQLDFRELLCVPDDYQILFLQGGAIAENALIPLNLLTDTTQAADYAVTGWWSQKSWKEAQRYGDIALAASSEAGCFSKPPCLDTWKIRAHAAYLHICSNETVQGVEFLDFPLGHSVPVVADMSSHLLSRPLDVSRFGVIYAGAQKNLGPAGLTVVIVRRDLLGHANPLCPSAFNWQLVASNYSMYNTPPTYAIYIAGLVLQWLKAQGGVAAIEQHNIAKAALLYGTLDRLPDVFYTKVDSAYRSRMNVPFFLRNDALQTVFLEGAQARGLVQLKGHQSVGGLRASIYNALSLEAVVALCDWLEEFAQHYG